MSYPRSKLPTTRSEFNARLLSLSNQNEELEARLWEAEQSCQHYQIKINAQHALVVDLMDAIHALAASSSSEIDNNSGGNIPEEMCVLLTQNARRVSELSQEVERMKLQLMQQIHAPNVTIENSSFKSDRSEANDNVDKYEDIPSSVSSSSSSTESGEKATQCMEELARAKSRCESLERSLEALKRKNTEREMRSMKSLRNMRWQISELEEERKRRLDLQITAEKRVIHLETELRQYREQTFQHLKNQESEIIVTENQSDTDLENIKSSTLKGVDYCRELVMLRNKVFRNSEDCFPLDLVAVSEDTGADDDSDNSEDECIPYSNAYLALE